MKRLLTSVILALALVAPALAQQPGGALSSLPNASLPLNGTELLYLVQGGISRKTTVGGVFQSFSGIIEPGLVNELAWYGSTGTTLGPLATLANGVLVTSAGGVPSISTTLPGGLTIPNPVITGSPILLGTGYAYANGASPLTFSPTIPGSALTGALSASVLGTVSAWALPPLLGLSSSAPTAFNQAATNGGPYLIPAGAYAAGSPTLNPANLWIILGNSTDNGPSSPTLSGNYYGANFTAALATGAAASQATLSLTFTAGQIVPNMRVTSTATSAAPPTSGYLACVPDGTIVLTATPGSPGTVTLSNNIIATGNCSGGLPSGQNIFFSLSVPQMILNGYQSEFDRFDGISNTLNYKNNNVGSNSAAIFQCDSNDAVTGTQSQCVNFRDRWTGDTPLVVGIAQANLSGYGERSVIRLNGNKLGDGIGMGVNVNLGLYAPGAIGFNGLTGFNATMQNIASPFGLLHGAEIDLNDNANPTVMDGFISQLFITQATDTQFDHVNFVAAGSTGATLDNTAALKTVLGTFKRGIDFGTPVGPGATNKYFPNTHYWGRVAGGDGLSVTDTTRGGVEHIYVLTRGLCSQYVGGSTQPLTFGSGAAAGFVVFGNDGGANYAYMTTPGSYAGSPPTVTFAGTCTGTAPTLQANILQDNLTFGTGSDLGAQISGGDANGTIRFCPPSVTSGGICTPLGQIKNSTGGGLVWGAPTGGDEGAGTINAQAIYIGGVPLSASGVSSVGNAASDATLTIAGTGSDPYTGAVTLKCTVATLSQIGCSEPGGGLSVSAGVVNVTNPAPSSSTSGDIATFSNTTGGWHDSGTLLSALAPKASPAFSGTITAPDAATWAASGIGSLNALGVGESAPGAGYVNVAGGYQVAGAALGIGNLANINSKTIVGNNGGSAAAPAALTVPNVQAMIGQTQTQVTAAGVSFSATGDTAVPITLPTGFTRYKLSSVTISDASASITGASVGIWTGTGETGAIIAAAQSPTVSTSADGTINNSMVMALTNTNTASYTVAGFPTLYFHVATGTGSGVTANVAVIIVPLL